MAAYRKLSSEGFQGLVILRNKVFLFCVRRDYPTKLNDLNIYPRLFSSILWRKLKFEVRAKEKCLDRLNG